jgi:hypothetical protein
LKLKENYMLLYERLLLPLKHSAAVLMISAVVFLAGTSVPGFNAVVSVMAAEKQSAAPAADTSAEATGLLTVDQLVELVAPVALYPDELLAITLPAATLPLEIVQASRYLEKHKTDAKLKPNEKWDSSILGLLNYPEVIALMNNDLDWTWKLGAAVADQQQDVMDAIQQFRNQAHTAGNLDSSEQQIIIVEKEIIKIESASPEVIYVPTYNPTTVVVHQTAPYPYYYSAPYPYYHNPAATFWTGMFVGAAVAYGVGWGGYGNNDININNNFSGGDRNTNIGGGDRNVGGGNKWNGGNKSGSGNRPGAGNRPGGGTRPGAGNRPGSRPSAGNRPGSRPGAGKRPSASKKASAGKRPSTGAGKRPSSGRKPSSMDRKQASRQPSRSRTGNKGSFGGYKSGGKSSRNSSRGKSSRSSQSRSRSSRSSASRGGGGRSRGGGGRSRGGGGRGGGGGRRR